MRNKEFVLLLSMVMLGYMVWLWFKLAPLLAEWVAE